MGQVCPVLCSQVSEYPKPGQTAWDRSVPSTRPSFGISEKRPDSVGQTCPVLCGLVSAFCVSVYLCLPVCKNVFLVTCVCVCVSVSV